MKKIQSKVSINAPAAKVYDMMLGLSDKTNYTHWTAEFNPTSTFEGNWEKGSMMRFYGVDEEGNQGGLVSAVVENIPNQFVSIKHLGLIKGDQEIMEGPEVETWANGFENYTFEEINGATMLTVDLDTVEDFADYFNETYPKALNRLKQLCEQ